MKTSKSSTVKLWCLNLALLLLLTTVFLPMSVKGESIHSITLHSNDGTEQSKEYTPSGSGTFDERSSIFASSTFAEEGKVIVGWSLNPDGTGDWYVPDNAYSNAQNEGLLDVQDLYAQWAEVNTDYLLFFPKSQKPADIADCENRYAIVDLTGNETVELPAGDALGSDRTVALWTYSSSGYPKDSKFFSPESTITASAIPSKTVLFAISSREGDPCTILDGNGGLSYNSNGTYWSRSVDEKYSFFYESEVKSWAASNGQYVGYDMNYYGRFRRDGYVLTGWNTEPDGSGENYYSSMSAVQIIKEQPIQILYAQWEAVEGNHLTYLASGHLHNSKYSGDDTISGKIPGSDGQDYLIEPIDEFGRIELKGSDTFEFFPEYFLGRGSVTKDSIRLLGWVTEDQSEEEILYGLNEIVEIKENTIFHAVWGVNTLIFDFNNNGQKPRTVFYPWSEETYYPQKLDSQRNGYYAGNKLKFTAYPERSGYELLGWNTKVDGTGVTYQPNSNAKDVPFGITLYAMWEKEGATPKPTSTTKPTTNPTAVPPPPPPPSGGGEESPDITPTASPSPSPIPEEVIEKAAKQFPDIQKHWGKEPIAWVYDKGLFYGVAENSFAPDRKMNRGMLASVLYRMAETPEVSGDLIFTDIAENSYYQDAVIWAAQNEIIFGMSENQFAPNSDITREQLASMLYRYAQKFGEAEPTGDLTQFKDADEISPWAKEAMAWAVGANVISGKGNQMLDPKGPASRAEVASMLFRFKR